MHRRILAVLGAALTLAGLAASPLRGEPAGPTASGASAASGATGAPTTTIFDIDHLPPDSPANPLRVYPNRPGAKYDDSEAAPNAALTISSARLRVASAAVAPHAALAPRSRPAAIAPYKTLGLVDGYAPRVSDDPGDVLHVVIHATPALFPVGLTCIATTASDGTVLLPYGPSHRPTTLGRDGADVPAQPIDVGFDFPLGARRGRVYVTCVNSILFGGVDATPFVGGSIRAVWAVDV